VTKTSFATAIAMVATAAAAPVPALARYDAETPGPQLPLGKAAPAKFQVYDLTGLKPAGSRSAIASVIIANRPATT
jgi:hypothetical protein